MCLNKGHSAINVIRHTDTLCQQANDMYLLVALGRSDDLFELFHKTLHVIPLTSDWLQKANYCNTFYNAFA